MDMESIVVTVASKYRYTAWFVLRKEVTAGGTTHPEERGACVVTRWFVIARATKIGLEILNAKELEIWPALNTVIDTVPEEAMSALLTEAVSIPVLTNVVASGFPFHSTTAPEEKLLPFTVSVKSLPPATVPDCDKLVKRVGETKTSGV
jgi:hypothetical protein